MKQRLSLARVLVHDPPVLLLDEPASGLDPRARIEIRELLKELQRLGKTILISSHILPELGEFCNKLGIIERGKLIVQRHGRRPDGPRPRPPGHLRPGRRRRPTWRSPPSGADPRVDRIDRPADQTASCSSPSTTPTCTTASSSNAWSPRGIAIDSVHPEKLKLEDVFLRLTKGIVQ